MAQQEIIKGIINKVLSADGINKVPTLLEIGPKYVSTNIPMDLVKRLIKSEAEEIQPWTFETLHMENGYSDMYPTASMGADLPLSVYILNREDVRTVYRKYLQMFETMKLNEFAFRLDDLSDPVEYPLESPYMLWTDNVTTKIYQFYSLEYPETEPSEDEENPEGEIDPNDPEGEKPNEDPNMPDHPGEPFDPTDPEPGTPEPPAETPDQDPEVPVIDPTLPVDPTQPIDPTLEP